ncbi:glycosyltransferase family 2 protein [Erythrobacter sp. WG]|uniref:glycosyltransferase family 2 protein n=1 Tax=Erythrobacter sp. WG TaxID=2985510 RepID=UPI00226F56E6|nr:glycosyltransferase family 2 protein [Erythrobacter sp. WG]MCX9145740.1 glycosyltransferase family 2 protein [Erythrobacter sp. WG]
MTSNKNQSFDSRVIKLWLTLRVHFDAFRLFPSRYLTATKWRVLRKRVRARGQFAPLLSRSAHAYALWAMSESASSRPQHPTSRIPVIALVQSTASCRELDSTCDSLTAAGIEYLIMRPPPEGSLAALVSSIDFTATPWVLPLSGGDRVSPNAGSAYAAAIAKTEAACTVVYADDDLLDRSRRRIDPHFKPDWNEELQRHCDILTGACIVRASAADLLEAAGSADWPTALVRNAASRGTANHIHAVLHHRRSRPVMPPMLSLAQISDALPPVSVIIPTRNRANLLRTCITGLRNTSYPDMEIIVANNDSDEPETLAYLRALASEGVTILDQPGPFNYSTINNNAVAIARGELICLMNNDIEVLSPDWLAIMVTQAMRPEVGAVGAQLLYPDGRIQHAGVVIGVGNAAGHAHRFLRPEAEGYFRRHALPQYVSAVTAACLVVRRDRFLAVGGLDEANFAVAFNDVDLCLKLNQRGWQSFYEPRAVLVHHESVSRGQDTDPVGAARFARELAALQRIWRTNESTDPYHHPMLSRASEQFALDLTSVAMPR